MGDGRALPRRGGARTRLRSRLYLGCISSRSRRHLHVIPEILRQAVLAHASYLDIASASAARASASADALARLRTRREAFANFLAKLVSPLGSGPRAAHYKPRHPAHTIAITLREHERQIGEPSHIILACILRTHHLRHADRPARLARPRARHLVLRRSRARRFLGRRPRAQRVRRDESPR